MELLMSRKKDRVLYQHRFNLSSEHLAHRCLHAYLDKLADSDEASAWVIESLLAALPDEARVACEETGEDSQEEDGQDARDV